MMDVAFLQGKTILITGGSGSFGQACVRFLLQHAQCKKIIIFSRDEWKQWQMQNSDPLFRDPRLRFFLGDVRDESRLRRAFHEVDIVIHAAALKQVPQAEYNPSEFVKTNIYGAMNMINAAIDAGVKQVIALSSDKAVNPINLYGATKLCSDKLFVSGNAYVGARGFPLFSVVRYGNVIGSRGSVILLWKKLLREGAKTLPLTHPEMTRFWITLEQSVQFVLDSLRRMVGGEIFVPKIPSMHITALAHALAPALPLEELGLRPGEKIHEVLISGEDARYTLAFPDYFVICPAHLHDKTVEAMKTQKNLIGEPLPPDFSYESHTNKEQLTAEQLRTIIA